MAALSSQHRASPTFSNVARPPKRSREPQDDGRSADDGVPGKRVRESPPWDVSALQLALVPSKQSPAVPVVDVDMEAEDERDGERRERTIEVHPAVLRRRPAPDPPFPPYSSNQGALVLYRPIVPVAVEDPLIEEVDEPELAVPKRSGSLRRRRDANAAADVFEVIEPSSPVAPPTLHAGLGAGSTSLTIDELPAAISSSSSSEAGGDDAMQID